MYGVPGSERDPTARVYIGSSIVFHADSLLQCLREVNDEHEYTQLRNQSVCFEARCLTAADIRTNVVFVRQLCEIRTAKEVPFRWGTMKWYLLIVVEVPSSGAPIP